MGGDGRFIGRLEAVEDVAARLGVDALGGVEVLDADRQALERTRVAGGEFGVARFRHRQRLFRRLDDEGVEALGALDRLQMGFGQFDATKIGALAARRGLRRASGR